jgi:hypothetical protein
MSGLFRFFLDSLFIMQLTARLAGVASSQPEQNETD